MAGVEQPPSKELNPGAKVAALDDYARWRAAFEAWAADKFSTHRHAYRPDRYLLDSTNIAWRAWQAGADHQIRSTAPEPAADYAEAVVSIWQHLSGVCPADFKAPEGESEKKVERAYCAAENALWKAGRLRLDEHASLVLVTPQPPRDG